MGGLARDPGRKSAARMTIDVRGTQVNQRACASFEKGEVGNVAVPSGHIETSGRAMTGWTIERIVHFDFHGDVVQDGLSHFGFHDRRGRYFAIAYTKHFMGLVGAGGRLQWTVAAGPVVAGVPNVAAPLEFPMYVDVLPDGALVVSNSKTAELYRIDPASMTARPLATRKGRALPRASDSLEPALQIPSKSTVEI